MIRRAFNRASEKQDSGNSIDILEAILQERPDLKDTPAVFPSQGQKGHTVIIGDEVFKGPQRSSGECRDDFDTECRTLKDLEGKELSVAVPRITTEGKDYLFFGMTRVPGETLNHDYQSTMTKEEQQQLAKDLINFVIEFAHAMPTKGNKFAMHGDLWHANIFINPETKRLSGVIDFGIVKYVTPGEWKPMYDFAGQPLQKMLQEEFDRRRSDLPGAANQNIGARLINRLKVMM